MSQCDSKILVDGSAMWLSRQLASDRHQLIVTVTSFYINLVSRQKSHSQNIQNHFTLHYWIIIDLQKQCLIFGRNDAASAAWKHQHHSFHITHGHHSLQHHVYQFTWTCVNFW